MAVLPASEGWPYQQAILNAQRNPEAQPVPVHVIPGVAQRREGARSMDT
ncbi:hypothetical protein CHELA1G2_14362 [Hyphomicrobiales bacterium]|nr:hypothetical protein CHELA1G2_14362 [Hyphomicrobiales bacterium]